MRASNSRLQTKPATVSPDTSFIAQPINWETCYLCLATLDALKIDKLKKIVSLRNLTVSGDKRKKSTYVAAILKAQGDNTPATNGDDSAVKFLNEQLKVAVAPTLTVLEGGKKEPAKKAPKASKKVKPVKEFWSLSECEQIVARFGYTLQIDCNRYKTYLIKDGHIVDSFATAHSACEYLCQYGAIAA